MKASIRRARRADVMRRRCPGCRNRDLSFSTDGVLCEACGEWGDAEHFPYQACYAPREGK